MSDFNIGATKERAISAAGYSILLVAETLTGGRVGAELCTEGIQNDPEEFAEALSIIFATEVRGMGAIDVLS